MIGRIVAGIGLVLLLRSCRSDEPSGDEFEECSLPPKTPDSEPQDC